MERTAVAAYNAGFGNVDSWLEDSEYSSDGKNLSHIPYSETASYVDKVENYKRYYENNISQEYITSKSSGKTSEQSDEDLSVEAGEALSENLNEYSDEYSDAYSDEEDLQ